MMQFQGDEHTLMSLDERNIPGQSSRPRKAASGASALSMSAQLCEKPLESHV